MLEPRLLHWVITILGQALDRRDRVLGSLAYWDGTRAHCSPVNVYRTGTARADAAAVLRADELQMVA